MNAASALPRVLPNGDRIVRISMLRWPAGGYQWLCPRLRLYVGERRGDSWAYGRLA